MSCLPDYNVQSVLLGITTNNGLEPYVREYWRLHSGMWCLQETGMAQSALWLSWPGNKGTSTSEGLRNSSFPQCPHHPWGLSRGQQVLHHQGYMNLTIV
jgi:hypothetical protein